MSDETVLLGPEVVASNVWLHVGAAGSILDEPCYVDGVVQSVTLWLRRDQASSGTCFLDVFDRHGDHFTLVRSARLSVDFARTTSSQTLSLAPTPVARGQYVGLRAVDGHLWLNYLDGPGAHLWWNVDPATGTAAKYISGESVGFNVTVVGRSGEGREWHGVNHPDTGRVLRWRSEEKPGLYSFLPSEFVLTLRPDSALPGFEPFLYLRQAASALTQLTDYRVRLRLRAAPRLRRAEREFLRGEIKRATGRPAVRLQAAFDLAARLSVAVGPAASVSGPQAEPAVDIREGFTLEYDLPAAEYGLVREQLTASGGGIIGSVHVPLGPGVEAAIPVRLTLRDVYIGGVTAGPPAGPLSKPSPNAVQIQIENQMPVPAIVGGLSILIAAGESEPPRVASPPGIQAVHWPLVVSASNHAMVTVRRPSEPVFRTLNVCPPSRLASCAASRVLLGRASLRRAMTC